MLGIERLNPDNVDLEDENVWKSIRDDTTLVFQWESPSAQAYLKKFMSDETIEIAKKKVPNFSMIKWLSFGNGLIRPACASFRDSVAKGEFYDNGFKELNEFLAPEAGRIAMQETIMMFLVKFCGYSNAKSDTVRRAIAKKKGTETLLPEIEERFVKYSSEHYNISKEKCEEVIKPFIKVICDASDYAFSWNHSDSYSILGYICGYLRYYYPFEFLTVALNVFNDNKSKTGEIIRYAKKIGITITPPKFGVSKGEYFYSKEDKSIAKGIGAVKYLNENAANELYELAHKKQYKYFIELLYDIFNQTSVNARQVEVLIKINYFSQFGNQRELLNIYEEFNKLKKGTAKSIKKAELENNPILHKIIRKNSTGTKKDGTPSKSYTLTNMSNILVEIEEYIKSLKIEDLSDVIKCRNFEEYMGYSGFVSGKDSDRRKLFIKSIYPLKRKKDGKQFGYSFVTQSIGSGKESRFTVFNRTYNQVPVKEKDIIKCISYTKEGKYFTLNNYQQIY